MYPEPFAKAPKVLLVGTTIMVAESVAFIFVLHARPTSFATFALTALLVWFVVRGNRLAWMLAVIGGLFQLGAPLAFDRPWWVMVSSAIALLCLLAPASRAFVGQEHPRAQRHPWASPFQHYYGYVAVHLDRLSGEAASKGQGLANRGVIGRVALCVAGLILIEGSVSAWYHGAGHNSAVVSALWHTVWILYVLAFLVLLTLLGVAAYNYLRKKGR